MTPVSIASVAASAVSLGLSVWLFASNTSAQSLQEDLQKQQQELQNKQQLVQAQQQRIQTQQEQINTGNALTQQVGPQVIQALGQAVVANKNDKIRGLLKKYGIEVSEKKDAKPKAGAAPEPAAPANP